MDAKESIERLAAYSSEIRNLTLKRLQEVPEGFMNWRLNNTAMSFAHIVRHLIDLDKLLFRLVNADENRFQWQLGSEEPHFVVEKSNYEAMVKELKELQNKRFTIICALDNSIINKEITDSNNKKTTFWWFIMQNVLEHEIYHRGQIAAYLKVIKGEAF